MMTVEAIVDKMQELLPGGVFNNVHLILTGGEPLLGWQRAYPDLLSHINRRMMNLKHITFETNGTQEPRDDLADYLNDCDYDVTFSVSSKLPSSGEKWEDAIKPEIVHKYVQRSNLTYFKWVVSNEDDYHDVVRAIEEYGEVINMKHVPVYLMPAGGTTKVYDNNEKWVADLAMKNGRRYTPRLQVQLWKNAWGT